MVQGVDPFFEQIRQKDQTIDKWKLRSLGFHDTGFEAFPTDWKDAFYRFIPHLVNVGAANWNMDRDRVVGEWEW
jgi:hypothetical protein